MDVKFKLHSVFGISATHFISCLTPKKNKELGVDPCGMRPSTPGFSMYVPGCYSVIFFSGEVVLGLGSGGKLSKLMKKACSVVGMKLDSVEAVTERRMKGKLKAGQPLLPPVC